MKNPVKTFEIFEIFKNFEIFEILDFNRNFEIFEDGVAESEEKYFFGDMWAKESSFKSFLLTIFRQGRQF